MELVSIPIKILRVIILKTIEDDEQGRPEALVSGSAGPLLGGCDKPMLDNIGSCQRAGRDENDTGAERINKSWVCSIWELYSLPSNC